MALKNCQPRFALAFIIVTVPVAANLNFSKPIMTSKVFVLAIITPSIPGMNFGAASNDGGRLFHDLFLQYQKAERPVLNHSDAVSVLMDPVLINLLNVDEVEEALTVNFWIRLFWTDEFLKWDPSLYGGRDIIHIPLSMIWQPDIYVFNSLRRIEHVNEEILFAKVMSTGYVQTGYPAIFETSCRLNIKYFPFDQQNCTLEFGSWSYDGLGLKLHKKRDIPPMDNYKPNQQWHLVKAAVTEHSTFYPFCPAVYPRVSVSFLVKRNSNVRVITLIIPVLIITAVSIVGLFSPSHSSGERLEKVTIGMITLLTMSVLLMMFSHQLPKTSKVVPILGIFYLYQLVICGAAAITTVAIMNLEKEGHYGHKAPDWARNFFIEVLPVYLGMDWRKKGVRRKITNVHWISNPRESILPKNYLKIIMSSECKRTTLSFLIQAEILCLLRFIHAREIRIDNRHVARNDWDRICDCIDRICMFIYIFLFAIGNLIIFFVL